jgi:hypothetical protein
MNSSADEFINDRVDLRDAVDAIIDQLVEDGIVNIEVQS